MEVLEHVMQTFHISRKAIGIGWLKDKSAIARQWISVYKSILDKIGGENAFVQCLSEITKIIETGWHTQPLSLVDHVSNTFFIRLRAEKKLSQDERARVEKTLPILLEQWFSNVFGDQRFGIENRNVEQGKNIIFHKKKIGTEFDRKFKIQAFCSWIFNEYAHWREKQTPGIWDGDIVRLDDFLCVYKEKSNDFFPIIASPNSYTQHMFFWYPTTAKKPYISDSKPIITWPVIWFHTMLASPETYAGKQEQVFFKQYGIEEKNLYVLRSKRIFWLRRPLYVYPEDTSWHWQDDDILVSFTLPSGSYASIFVDILMNNVSYISK